MHPRHDASRPDPESALIDGLYLLRRSIEIEKLIFLPMEPMYVRPSLCTRGMLVVRPKGMGVSRHMPEGDFNYFFFPQAIKEVRHA